MVGGGGDGSREKHRWAESKVYTRKSFNKSRNSGQLLQTSSQTLTGNEDGSSSQQQQQKQKQQQVPSREQEQQQQLLSRFDAASDDSSSLNRLPPAVVGGGGGAASRDAPSGNNGFFPRTDDNRVIINLSSRSRQELREVRSKLTGELDQVRALVKRLELREQQLSGYSHSQLSASDPVGNGGGPPKRGNSEVGSVMEAPARPPKRQLSVSVIENSHGGVSGEGGGVEKEKRTPKANQYYRNSEFLLGKDRLPPAESNKKLKTNGSKKFSSGDGDNYGMDGNLSRAFKECGGVLSKLMKHKHGWVFNTPVNVKALGLHDYYTIIKHPMDLGTVKSRLNKNWYKSPREFAEDVRLTFRNAMTYNPKGQDVHVMAEQLLSIFEERWAALEADRKLGDNRFNVDREFNQPLANLMRKAPPKEMKRTLDRSESTNFGIDPKPKAASFTSTGRVAAPKKPKAKDPNKRDMTYDEKQKLSANLMNLPPEKLDNIVHIIRKRNPTIYHHDDEIEVDIESFDAETLWELDRLVTNYKKSLSKNKKKAELANQTRLAAHPNNVQDVNPVPGTVEVVKESKKDEKNDPPSSPVEREKHGDNASRSSSSSSSSSDSGSSSSDSDSDSSSASDAPRSPQN
ncbi:transcription factor GTE4 [Cinnamomum micranthum f. kanehirae]|uniref:Transcription factor GTE4 n=1 Tax=Cinnamomum micranthum f. kanehirae TaxID=337451 RepID=A0A3S3PA66_9MAGN|nr:transcription factor GTE4 [Cinnamomum micranthum f. kanehirae]